MATPCHGRRTLAPVAPHAAAPIAAQPPARPWPSLPPAHLALETTSPCVRPNYPPDSAVFECGIEEECSMVQVTNKQTGVVVVMPIEQAAEVMQLEVVDIEWAIEEAGICETDTHECVDPS